jgi:molybdopterin converting factor subunit 1
MNDHARVLFFATLRDRTGVKETTLEFPQGTNIAEIKNIVLKKYPALDRSMETIIVALNHEFAFDGDIVKDGAEIAMFPPVSGGESSGIEYLDIIRIVEEEIVVDKIVEEITLPVTGGICIFTGTVREVTRRKVARQTEHLVYEAYQTMAEAKMRQICNEIRSRWTEIKGRALVQRTGKLLPGSISVVVACSAAHRDSGIFEAARYGIDRLKEIVPIWKKEISKDGEQWIEGEYHPQRGE